MWTEMQKRRPVKSWGGAWGRVRKSQKASQIICKKKRDLGGGQGSAKPVSRDIQDTC
jgi:hypothetical protein